MRCRSLDHALGFEIELHALEPPTGLGTARKLIVGQMRQHLLDALVGIATALGQSVHVHSKRAKASAAPQHRDRGWPR